MLIRSFTNPTLLPVKTRWMGTNRKVDGSTEARALKEQTVAGDLTAKIGLGGLVALPGSPSARPQANRCNVGLLYSFPVPLNNHFDSYFFQPPLTIPISIPIIPIFLSAYYCLHSVLTLTILKYVIG